MHGRIKVRTSEEEKIRKEKERQEKLKIYRHAMQTIQTKRKEGNLDKELLDLTGQILVSNTDISTLWNIRREIIILLRKTEDEKDLSKLCDAELQLTEYCLKMNPKSYYAWYQREWILTTRPDPDWKKELNLCNTYLKLDERNFHTWDYRRFVIGQLKPPLEEEFKYTTEKLHDNFSNYSAWHYRSKMLVELYPDIEGAVKKTTNLVVCAVSDSKTTVAFSEYVSRDFVESKTELFIGDTHVIGDWVAVSNNQYDVLWILRHDVQINTDKVTNIRVEYTQDNGEKLVIPCVRHESGTYVGKTAIDFQNKYSQPVIDELKNQLESCRQLLALEPDNRWTLLTTTVFLHCIDAKLYSNEAIVNLQTLKSMDKLRAGYYDHLISKWSIEEQLTEDYVTNEIKFKPTFSDKLSSLPHLQYYSFCQSVDLSNQNLSSKILPSLVLLQHCEKLNLENNNITTLDRFPILGLKELNLKGNELNLREVEEIRKIFTKCNVIY